MKILDMLCAFLVGHRIVAFFSLLLFAKLSFGSEMSDHRSTSLSKSIGVDYDGELNLKQDADQKIRWDRGMVSKDTNLSLARITTSVSGTRCTTPNGGHGTCVHLQDCPTLLTNFKNLQKSFCFKTFFSIGLCCPEPLSSDLSVQDQEQSNLHLVTDLTTLLTDPTSLTTQQTPLKLSQFLQAPNGNDTKPYFDQINPFSNSKKYCGFAPLSKILPASFRIVGGELSKTGEYPWMAAIMLKGRGKTRKFWCGGSVLTNKFVITAAHCTRKRYNRVISPSRYLILLGVTNIKQLSSPNIEALNVIEVISHPSFRRNGFYNDLALLKVAKPIEFSDYIRPICLPFFAHEDQRKPPLAGQTAVALGWGATKHGLSEVNTLRSVSIPIWTKQSCDAAYLQNITDVFLCAGNPENNKDACQGDSGGPLMLLDDRTNSWTLVGIVSFGNGCAKVGFPGVYTNIVYFLDWIQSII